MQNTSHANSSSRIAGLRAPHTAQPVAPGRTQPAHYPPVGADLSGHPSSGDAQRTQTRKVLSVLIAEDNFANQLIAKTLLLRAGFHVTSVDNGEDAITIGLTTAFDIILMDIEMPIRNGIEATQALRSQPGPNQSTLIIALTAFGSPAEKYTYGQSGIDHVLTKPFRIDALSAILNAENLKPETDEIEPPKSENLPNRKIRSSRADTDLVDVETIRTLFDAAGYEGLMPVLKAYWRSAYALLVNMQEAHQVWDRDKLQKLAHAMKGASVNIGLPAIGRLAATLQNAPPGDGTELLDNLDITMARSRKALAREIARLKQQARTAR